MVKNFVAKLQTAPYGHNGNGTPTPLSLRTTMYYSWTPGIVAASINAVACIFTLACFVTAVFQGAKRPVEAIDPAPGVRRPRKEIWLALLGSALASARLSTQMCSTTTMPIMAAAAGGVLDSALSTAVAYPPAALITATSSRCWPFAASC